MHNTICQKIALSDMTDPSLNFDNIVQTCSQQLLLKFSYRKLRTFLTKNVIIRESFEMQYLSVVTLELKIIAEKFIQFRSSQSTALNPDDKNLQIIRSHLLVSRGLVFNQELSVLEFRKRKKCQSLHRITNTARRGAEEPGAKRCTRSNYGLMSRQSSGSSKMQKDLLGQNLLVLATVGINSQLGILQDIGFLTAVWRVSNLSPASKPAILKIVV